MKALLKDLCPPLLWRSLKQWRDGRSLPEWQYAGSHWAEAQRLHPARGWNQASVQAAYEQQWYALRASISAGTFLYGDLAKHNMLMVFAYALALAAQGKKRLSILDWGGSIGFYNLYAQAFLPGVEIDYHCKDVGVLVEAGRKLQPDATFYTDESCLNRTYDLVLVSGSLQYSEDWAGTLRSLLQATDGYLLLTRLFVTTSEPCLCLQRAYGTEYIGWVLEREAVLGAVDAALLQAFELTTNPTPLAGSRIDFTQRGFLWHITR